MMRLGLSSAVALVCILAVPAFTRSTAALGAAHAIDSEGAYPNVGTIMVWRDANNPVGQPGGLAAFVTGVLIHPQAILTAGHFTARVEGISAGGQLPPWLRIVVSFAADATDQSTWIDLDRALGTCLAHPSFPRPCTPQSCPFDDIDGQYEPGISDVGLCFLDEPVANIRPAKLANRRLDQTGIPGTRMTIVGFGTTAPPPGGPADTTTYDGLRRWGTSTVDQVVDQNWVTFKRDPVTVCFGDSGAPTFFHGRVVAIASDGAADCASADVRARVDSPDVRNWITSQIDRRFAVGDSAVSSVASEEPLATPHHQAEGVRASLGTANSQLAAMGASTRISQVEWLTRSETGQVGQTVFFNHRGNKQLAHDFAPGDPRRGGRTSILYLVDQSDGAAVGGLTNADTEAAIDRAVATWNDVACSHIPIEKAPDTGADPDVADFFFGGGDLGTINLGPVTTVDIVHGGFVGAALFDALTPGCVPGSVTNPCGSVFVLGVTFTDVFVDEDGTPTDINHDGKLDVAFREIFYNNSDPDANGATIPWRIDAHPDVETTALHEFGHGLSQAHFGKVFSTDSNGKVHFAPLAIMNAGTDRVSQRLLGTDVGGHCSIWADWPNQ
jgi:hypothetical protein